MSYYEVQGDAASGAAKGFMVAGPVGAAVGAVVGAFTGFGKSKERKAREKALRDMLAYKTKVIKAQLKGVKDSLSVRGYYLDRSQRQEMALRQLSPTRRNALYTAGDLKLDIESAIQMQLDKLENTRQKDVATVDAFNKIEQARFETEQAIQSGRSAARSQAMQDIGSAAFSFGTSAFGSSPTTSNRTLINPSQTYSPQLAQATSGSFSSYKYLQAPTFNFPSQTGSGIPSYLRRG